MYTFGLFSARSVCFLSTLYLTLTAAPLDKESPSALDRASIAPEALPRKDGPSSFAGDPSGPPPPIFGPWASPPVTPRPT